METNSKVMIGIGVILLIVISCLAGFIFLNQSSAVPTNNTTMNNTTVANNTTTHSTPSSVSTVKNVTTPTNQTKTVTTSTAPNSNSGLTWHEYPNWNPGNTTEGQEFADGYFTNAKGQVVNP